jgi:hypothetical protein
MNLKGRAKIGVNIQEQLLYTTVRLEGHTSEGTQVGTGFFFGRHERVYLVANKHVIQGVERGSFTMMAGQAVGGSISPRHGYGIEADFCEADFVGHPDPSIDVAVTNVSDMINELMSTERPPFIRVIEESAIPNEERVSNFIGPLENVIIIGYPDGIWDSVSILPIARQGMTATPYYIDFMGRPQFLIDASIFPGSSGSPVFICSFGTHHDRKGNVYVGSRADFLGLVCSVFSSDDGELEIIDIPTLRLPVYKQPQRLDLGVVLKASTVLETTEAWENRAEASH